MDIISEKINGMFGAVRRAIAARDGEAIRKIALRQLAAGANVLDINVGTAAEDPPEAMRWLVRTAREVTGLPLCLDNPKLAVIKSGAEEAGENFIINSTTAREPDLSEFLAFAAESGARIIALTMDENGVPNSAEGRVEIGAKIIIAAEAAGVPPERVLLDPITLPINVAQDQPRKMLETISQFKLISDPPPRVVIGLSNLSSGTKEKSLLNSALLAMAMGAGLDAVILDPEDKLLMDTLISSEVILNKVIYNDDYLKAFRS